MLLIYNQVFFQFFSCFSNFRFVLILCFNIYLIQAFNIYPIQGGYGYGGGAWSPYGHQGGYQPRGGAQGYGAYPGNRNWGGWNR